VNTLAYKDEEVLKSLEKAEKETGSKILVKFKGKKSEKTIKSAWCPMVPLAIVGS
jgi:hypothetical protein